MVLILSSGFSLYAGDDRKKDSSLWDYAKKIGTFGFAYAACRGLETEIKKFYYRAKGMPTLSEQMTTVKEGQNQLSRRIEALQQQLGYEETLKKEPSVAQRLGDIGGALRKIDERIQTLEGPTVNKLTQASESITKSFDGLRQELKEILALVGTVGDSSERTERESKTLTERLHDLENKVWDTQRVCGTISSRQGRGSSKFPSSLQKTRRCSFGGHLNEEDLHDNPEVTITVSDESEQNKSS